MSEFINLLLDLSYNFGYLGIVFLMTVESSFIPFPSEVVIIPAAFLASMGEMNIFLVVLSGIAGSLIGALLNYFLARYLGRTIVYNLVDYKIFKLLLINKEKIEKAEAFFRKYGGLSTLVGRLVPVVRQLISLPAGFSKMRLPKFISYTVLGSSIWVIILAFLGYFFGSQKELLDKYFREISILFIILSIIVFIVVVRRRRQKAKLNSINKQNSI